METAVLDQMVEAHHNFERFSHPYTLIGFLVSQEFYDNLSVEVRNHPFEKRFKELTFGETAPKLTAFRGLPVTVSPNLPAFGNHIAPVLTKYER